MTLRLDHALEGRKLMTEQGCATIWATLYDEPKPGYVFVETLALLPDPQKWVTVNSWGHVVIHEVH